MSETQLTIRSLDGLRGFAVLAVLLSHLSLHGMNALPWLDFSGFGKAGVYLFFVLSAFLLTYQALGQGLDGVNSPRYWAGYLVRRVCRIYPLYTLVLIAALVLTTQTGGYGPKIPDVQTFGLHLVLLQGTSVYWAIPVEFSYYLLLPLICIALLKSAQLSIWWSALLVLGLTISVSFVWPPAEVIPNSIVLMPYLQMFLLGTGLAMLVLQPAISARFEEYRLLIGVAGWLVLLAAMLTIPSFWRLLIDDAAGNKVFHTSFVLYATLWVIAVLAALYGAAGFTRFFEAIFWRFLGRVSFSIYLWHLPIVQWIDRHTSIPGEWQFLLCIGAIVPLSYVSYRLVERPLISWGHRITQHWRSVSR